MAIEIERKFLLKYNSWRHHISHSELIQQGYLNNASSDAASVRVRIAKNVLAHDTDHGSAWLSVKSSTQDISRHEFEYSINVNEAQFILDNLCQGRHIKKQRHYLHGQYQHWLVDEFLDHNQPLLLAEIELTSSHQNIALPTWLGKEVSDDKRYFNSALASN